MVIKRSPGTPATAALEHAAVPHTLHHYSHDPRAVSFGLEAAASLGVDPSRVYKTLLVDSGDGLAVGVVPVECSLDLKSLSAVLGVKKLVMADPARAERSSGMVLGGISPIGQKRPLPTVLDASMRNHETVLVSGGRRGLDVELTPADLARLVNATFAAISRSGPC
ncbi:Cys-tRNA(Pro) deacylase [Tessaracoccus sp.]